MRTLCAAYSSDSSSSSAISLGSANSPVAEGLVELSTTVPIAYLFETWVTLILADCPCWAPATNMTKPSIFAMPSPRLLVSEIVTSYSFPTSTGFGLSDLKPLSLPPNPPRLP